MDNVRRIYILINWLGLKGLIKKNTALSGGDVLEAGGWTEGIRNFSLLFWQRRPLPAWCGSCWCSHHYSPANNHRRMLLSSVVSAACVADSYKHPCTQSAQLLQFACSNFHENKKPFLIGYFGLVWYAPFDWPKIMITLHSRAYNKNKCRDGPLEKWWGGWAKSKKNSCKPKSREKKFEQLLAT